MGAIWDPVNKGHTITFKGKVIGKVEVDKDIKNSLSTSDQIETTLKEKLSSHPDRDVYIHIYDKATGEYALHIGPKGFKPADKWWDPPKE